ncbi:MAG TPA: hypothetical protein VFD01_16615 [Candidatus Dormibacteraeota bacterium]|nr:hypothetical protein [Candidatus Dormibacteraeota bacterium]
MSANALVPPTGPGRAVPPAVVALLVLVSCTAPTRGAAPGLPHPTARPSPSAQSVRTCFVAPPERWTELLDRRAVALPPGLSFGVGAVGTGGTEVYGQLRSPAGEGVAELDLGSGRLTSIASYPPGASGLGWMAAEFPWLVWEEGDSRTDLGSWSLYAWNQRTGRRLLLARSGGGDAPPGQPPLPALRGGEVTWAQPVPGGGPAPRAQVHVFDLAHGRDTVLATGTVSSPVFAGPYLVWARIDARGSTGLQAVDAADLRPASLPAGVGHPGSVGYLAGSREYLVWSSGDLTRLTAWRIGTGGSTIYTSDLRHPFQFLQLAGHFLLWFGGATASILDLETGAAFDLPGTVAGSGGTIVAARPLPGSGTRVSDLPLQELGPDPRCPG